MDMKGQGIMELMAFLAMKRQGVRLRGDLLFLAVADEETLGEHGAEFLIEKYPEDFKADLVINEGGIGLRDMLANKPTLLISTAEKGLRWLKLTRTGPPGHGSAPHGQNALEELTKALNRLLTEESPVTITPIIAEYFRKMGQGWDFLNPYIEDGKTETLVNILNQSGLLAIPQISAMVRNTISLTGMQAGTNVNVIPGTTEAQLDIRLLPGQDGDSFMKAIKERLGDTEISFDLTGSTEPTESRWGTQDYALIEEVLQEEFPGCIVAPYLLFTASDSRFFRHKGIPAYGIFPVLVSLEDINMIHGIDEKISVENMIKGTEVYTKIIRRLCA
jgi:acetylornithine deacetylase/succinyl-diaminopimelate desuccinylase-like protein